MPIEHELSGSGRINTAWSCNACKGQAAPRLPVVLIAAFFAAISTAPAFSQGGGDGGGGGGGGGEGGGEGGGDGLLGGGPVFGSFGELFGGSKPAEPAVEPVPAVPAGIERSGAPSIQEDDGAHGYFSPLG